MRAASAMLRLVAARARRSPGRWLLTVLGLALATAFAGAVAAQSTVAGDQAARSVLRGAGELDRSVSITWPNVVTPAVARQAQGILTGAGLGAPTEVVLLAPVRLSGIVVRPAAIQPLSTWLSSPASPDRCMPTRCPMVLVAGNLRRVRLSAPGVRILVSSRSMLRSAAPLGFVPGAGQPPLLLTGDVHGLESLPGLSGVYRSHSWLAPLPIDGLHSWQLASSERRLATAQSRLLAEAGGFSLSAPFGALDAARAQAAASPRRLLLAGGGSLAAIVLFLVLAVAAVRRDVDAELGRLEIAGARTGDRVLFVVLEAAAVCAAGLLLGAMFALAIGAIEAAGAGAPVGGVLDHSLLTGTAALSLGTGWACAVGLVVVLLLVKGTRMADLLAAVATAVLAAALILGSQNDSQVALLLAPLACLAAGLLVYRATARLLQAGERIARRGPVMTRLALVGLARSPSGPSLAVAFIALSTGLGGFALAYRATLLRSTADQAADQVPLDATVAAGPSFATPLQLASLARWQTLADGSVWPVRRTEASYVSGGSSVTVPALGVPSAALMRLHGWRGSDGSAPLATLARRITAPRRTLPAAPRLPPGGRMILLSASAPGLAITLTADLRRPDGTVLQLPLGSTARHLHLLRGRLPAAASSGAWQLEALAASEPSGLEVTNGHQNGENPAPATEFATRLGLGQVRVLRHNGHTTTLDISRWRGVGAASAARASGGGVSLRFAATGQLGLVRPVQPSDTRRIPVLADPQTAAVAGRGGQLGLSVDGLPVRARVVGVIRRFPTVTPESAGFLVADEQTLASALDAQLPGQGNPDELWVSSRHLDGLRAGLAGGQLRQLTSAFRDDIEHRLRSAPIARAVLRTLVAASALGAVLAILGLLVTLLGSGRDTRVQDDLLAQGVGPAALRSEVRLRLLLAATIGVCLGAAIGVVLTRLAVATVRAAGTVALPRPPVVTVAPWAELALWSLAVLAALAAVAWLATRARVARTPR